MLAFINRQFDILVATTIIESGLDIPNVNTIFINEADKYGLADLHQLRGRVGRYKHRAYAYLLLESDKSVTPNAVKRLKAIEEFTQLGAGFKIALRDLEIRGAGNILGAEQSGHIESVGYELYCSLLESAARALTNQPEKPLFECSVELAWRAYLPRDYVPSARIKLELYRRLGRLRTLSHLARLPPGDDRPLRSAPPAGREPADRNRDPHHGRCLEARPDPRRARPVRRPDLPRHCPDRGPGPPPSRAWSASSTPRSRMSPWAKTPSRPPRSPSGSGPCCGHDRSGRHEPVIPTTWHASLRRI